MLGTLRVLVISGLLAMHARAALVNGDWSTGDETGWIRWRAAWGDAGGESWSVTTLSPTAPEATMSNVSYAQAEFGWYQIVTAPESTPATLSALWSGSLGSSGWTEIMLFSVVPETTEPDILNRIYTDAAADIAFKKDSWGMNPPNPWSWQSAGDSPHPSGNGGTVTSLGWVVVGLKLGSVSTNAASVSVDNVNLEIIPEPGIWALVGLGVGCLILLLLNRRNDSA